MWTLNAEWKLPEAMLEITNDSTEKQNQNLKSWIYNKLTMSLSSLLEITMKEKINSYRDD